MKRIAFGLLMAAALPAAQAQPLLAATQYGDFSTYTLALSWQNGFCQSMKERGQRLPAECKLSSEASNAPLLTAHGLWPSLPKSVAARGVDNKRWMRFGCATRPSPGYPEVRERKCDLPATGINPTVQHQLSSVMPGAAGRSCLERYEYAKHGMCLGFDPDSYFSTLARLTQQVNTSLPGQWLAQHAGQTVKRKEFNQVVARSWGDAGVNAIKLTCHGNPAYLTEIQIILDARQINDPLSAQNLVSQPRPGNCPARFLLQNAAQ